MRDGFFKSVAENIESDRRSNTKKNAAPANIHTHPIDTVLTNRIASLLQRKKPTRKSRPPPPRHLTPRRLKQPPHRRPRLGDAHRHARHGAAPRQHVGDDGARERFDGGAARAALDDGDGGGVEVGVRDAGGDVVGGDHAGRVDVGGDVDDEALAEGGFLQEEKKRERDEG